MIDEIKMYGRFASRLRPFLKKKITLKDARAVVKRRLAERGDQFLRLMEKGVFGYPDSPYLALMKLAGCEMGDLRNMVRDRGLDETLLELRRAGVYVDFDEFKGRKPIVRQGRVIPLGPTGFDNPFTSSHYYTQSGGTTGAGTRAPQDLDNLVSRSYHDLLFYEAHGLLGVPTAMWFGILPSGGGVNTMLRQVQIGQLAEKWFTPLVPGDLRPALRFRLATWAIVTTARLLGEPFPYPELLRLDQAEVLARWAANAIQTRGACLIRTYVSAALRVCLAAREAGLDLTGATFIGAGEAATPAKARGIAASGARLLSSYTISEMGAMGKSCAVPADESDVHFFHDIYGLITHPRRAPNSDALVDAFHFTTLLPTAPKILLNVEADDYGILERRPCGCLLGEYGFDMHIREVRSFQKLTGEGMTLVGSDMVRVLEEVLPARFGGSPLDYQLEEVEDEQGFTRLNLVIHPRIKIDREADVIETVAEELKRGGAGSDLARAYWQQAGSLRVKRAEPVWTSRGKLMPLRPGRRSEASGAARQAP